MSLRLLLEKWEARRKEVEDLMATYDSYSAEGQYLSSEHDAVLEFISDILQVLDGV